MIDKITYEELIEDFTPRYIRTEEEYEEHILVKNRLMDVYNNKRDLTTDEKDYFTLIGMVISRYEADINQEDEDAELLFDEFWEVLKNG